MLSWKSVPSELSEFYSHIIIHTTADLVMLKYPLMDVSHTTDLNRISFTGISAKLAEPS